MKRVLIIGSSGSIGKLLMQHLANVESVQVYCTTRRRSEVTPSCFFLDLNDPSSFGPAVSGMDTLFLLTGYTVDMLVQSKCMVDAAKKAGVSHVVHLGVFANWDCTDAHFVWHQLVESYIAASGMNWTNLHPNVFMDNLLPSGMSLIRDGCLSVFWKEKSVGWVALSDVAECAAVIIACGERFFGKDFYFSTQSATTAEVAASYEAVVGRHLECACLAPDALVELLASTPEGAGVMEKKYAEGGVEFARQVVDNRMAYIATVRDDVPYILGRNGITLEEFFNKNKDQFSK